MLKYALIIGLLLTSLPHLHLFANETQIKHNNINSFKCVFIKSTRAKYDLNDIKIYVSPYSKDERHATMFFDSVNLKNNTARFTANAGTVSVIAYITNRGLNFLESSISGNVIHTTIFNAPMRKNIEIRFPAVMSRHINMTNEPIPSQNYGFCVPSPWFINSP